MDYFYWEFAELRRSNQKQKNDQLEKSLIIIGLGLVCWLRLEYNEKISVGANIIYFIRKMIFNQPIYYRVVNITF